MLLVRQDYQRSRQNHTLYGRVLYTSKLTHIQSSQLPLITRSLYQHENKSPFLQSMVASKPGRQRRPHLSDPPSRALGTQPPQPQHRRQISEGPRTAHVTESPPKNSWVPSFRYTYTKPLFISFFLLFFVNSVQQSTTLCLLVMYQGGPQLRR